jgi:ABC-2 type transport system permease protein
VTLAMTVGLPVLQLIMYGYALETRVRHVPAAVVNLDQHAPGRLLAHRIAASPLFAVDPRWQSSEQMTAAIRRGAIRAGIEIPADYSTRLLYGREPAIRVWVDGADAAMADYLLTAFETIGLDITREQWESRAAAVTGENGPSPVRVQATALGNPSGRTTAYLLPALIAILVQTIVIILMGLSVAYERERGTLTRMLVTPLGPGAIILGKAAAVLTVGAAETLVLILLMRSIFAIPIAGSFWLMAVLIPLLVLLPLGLGAWIAAMARNHSQVVQYTNVLVLPSILLSGFVFPREFLRFPFDWASRCLPMTFLVAFSRNVILRGAPGPDLLPEIMVMAAMALVFGVTGFWALYRSMRP